VRAFTARGSKADEDHYTFDLLAAYYGFARHLPSSDNHYAKWTRAIRRAACRGLFAHMGHGVNVEHKACFGMDAIFASEITPGSALIVESTDLSRWETTS